MKTSRLIFLIVIIMLAGLAFPHPTNVRPPEGLGVYFSKKRYTPKPLPTFDNLRNQLPSPVYDDNPLWVKTYWKAWELAFRNFHQPAPGTGYVSNFIDAAFNQDIFLWDSCFMSMFCNYAYPLVPGISTLDNFYAKQHKDGEISREIVRATGVDFKPWINREDRPLFSRWGWWGWPDKMDTLEITRNIPVAFKGREPPTPNPVLTLDALNNPILAWAELEHYQITGDRRRLQEVWEPLVHYYQALRRYLRQENGLYVTDWASMDNSPRNKYLKGGGTGIDISSEMVLFARELSQIAEDLGKEQQAKTYSNDANKLASIINRRMWDKKKKFYFDLQLNGKRVSIMTIAAYWTLLAKVASRQQAAALVAQLENPDTFGRLNMVPTVAANQPGYDPEGGYWRGSVWVPTDTMVIEGLENYGYDGLARKIALNYLDLVAEVFQKTGTIWENYAPDSSNPGQPAKPNFVGWSGLGPIGYFLEYAIGIRPDAPRNELIWHLESGGRRGCKRYRFGGHIVTLIASPEAGKPDRMRINVTSDGVFRLRVLFKGNEESFTVTRGSQELQVSTTSGS